jgi:hypothetical protein
MPCSARPSALTHDIDSEDAVYAAENWRVWTVVALRGRKDPGCTPNALTFSCC